MLCYYAGDTFSLPLTISLQRDGQGFSIGEDDTISLQFINCRGETVTELEYTNIENNTVIVEWSRVVTRLFQPGEYRYRIRYNGEHVRTIAENRILVE